MLEQDHFSNLKLYAAVMLQPSFEGHYIYVFRIKLRFEKAVIWFFWPTKVSTSKRHHIVVNTYLEMVTQLQNCLFEMKKIVCCYLCFRYSLLIYKEFQKIWQSSSSYSVPYMSHNTGNYCMPSFKTTFQMENFAVSAAAKINI